MNSKFFIAFFAIIAAAAHAQLYYSAPTVAEYAWPAVGESAPYYAAGYAGIPVAAAAYPSYAYTYGSASKRSPPQTVPQKPSAAFFTNNNKA